MHDALNVPEILLEIFSYLEDDGSSLYSIIRVNKQWFECGTSILWKDCFTINSDAEDESRQGPSSFNALEKVPQRRRHLYVSKMRALNVSADDNRSTMFLSHPSKMSLTDIGLTNYNFQLTGLQHISRFMQSPLRKLRLFDSLIDSHLVRHLSKNCPQVREIAVTGCAMKPPLTLPSFFELFPSLHHIHVLSHEEGLLNSDTVLYVAKRRNLEYVGLVGPSEEDALAKVSAHVKDPFPDIRSLTFCNPSIKLPPLIPMIRNIKRLSLFAPRESVDYTLKQISQLTELRHLELHVDQSRGLHTRDGLMSLTSLINIRSLEIKHARGLVRNALVGLEPYGGIFSSEDFDKFISHFPHLRHLCMDSLLGSLDAEALESIAKYCIRINSLRSLSLTHFSDYVVENPSEYGPTMPNLHEMVIGCLAMLEPEREKLL